MHTYLLVFGGILIFIGLLNIIDRIIPFFLVWLALFSPISNKGVLHTKEGYNKALKAVLICKEEYKPDGLYSRFISGKKIVRVDEFDKVVEEQVF